jgi:putative intracellular protease/amidase
MIPSSISHGPMWDLAEDLVKRIESFRAAGKPVAEVCHTPGVLRHVKAPHRPAAGRGKEGDRVHRR